MKKSGFGRWLDDVAYTFAEISLLGLPALWVVMLSTDLDAFGLKAASLVAWMAMVVTAATIRGGWVTPLWTDVPGWVTLSPSLLILRLVYYNATLALASFGGVWVGGVADIEIASIPVALLVGSLSAAAFPRLAEVFYGHVLDW